MNGSEISDRKFLKINFGGIDFAQFRWRTTVGLGNLLCTWGEAMLYARQNELSVLWPTWPQVSKSALLWGRSYFGIFKNNGYYVEGDIRDFILAELRRGRKLKTVTEMGPKIPYNMDWNYGNNSLEDIYWLKEQLLAIAAPKIHRCVLSLNLPKDFITIHVRRGDFLNEKNHFLDGDNRYVNRSISIDWYITALEIARQELGNVHAICISDGSRAELEPLLACPNVTLQSEHALVDLLSASQSIGLIASGSTFSMWIAYLGQMPTWIHQNHSWCESLHKSSLLRKL